MKFDLNKLSTGFNTHALVISGLGMIWFSFIGGGLDLGEAIQQSLMVASVSTLRMAVPKK